MAIVTTGITPLGDYATPATDADKVQALLDLVAPESNPARMVLAAIPPSAQRQLIVELESLKSNVT